MTPADQCQIDPKTVAALYAAHAEELRLFVAGVLRDHDAAEDVLQLTFTKAVEAGHTARAETRKGWLFQVAFHEALAWRRRQAVHQRATRQLAWSQWGDQSSESLLPPDAALIQRETTTAMQAAIAALPPAQRQVVVLRIFEEKTFAEIASEVNAPLGTVLTRMQLALRRLRRVFSPSEPS